MKKIYLTIAVVVLMLFSISAIAQDRQPVELSLGGVKTELKNSAINFGIKYIRDLFEAASTSTFKAGNKHLFDIGTEFNINSGTKDAFSSIDVKVQGLLMFFDTIKIAGIESVNTSQFFNVVPFSIGMETNNRFDVANGILEVGYVPYYQNISNFPKILRSTKIGVFFQTGKKFDIGNSSEIPMGGAIDESKENIGDEILRIKGSLAIDTKNLFAKSMIGLSGGVDYWYDLLNTEVYYTLSGKLRFYTSKDKLNFFDFKYQKGSGAPNFNQGDEFGIGLTVTF